MRTLFQSLLLAASLGGFAGCAVASTGAPSGPDMEYRVYASILQMLGETRPNMVVADRTVPLPCPMGECLGNTSRDLWPDVWADYVRKNESAVDIRAGGFGGDVRVRLSGREVPPPVDCSAHPWIALSRVGFNADSTLAMVHWFQATDVGPTRGCNDRYGILTVLERRADGTWHIISPRPLHPYGISPLPA
ncbi:MAG TPA: hypothetical protein VLK84_23880 [Longimicrobium sp.]|nr:hypothetical protein [Longimicrobium sp.]